MATRKLLVRTNFMESTFRPAWTSRRLDGYQIVRERVSVVGSNCYVCVEAQTMKKS